MENSFEKQQELRKINQALLPQQRRKNYVLFFTFIVVVFLIVAGAIFRIFSPPKIVIPETTFSATNTNGTVSKLTSITYTGDDFTPPETFSIFKPTTSLSEQQVINRVISRYHLEKIPDIDAWADNNQIYLSELNPSEYSLVFNGDPFQQSPPVILDTAIQPAQEVMSSLFPELQLKAVPDKVTYWIFGIESQKTDKPENATGISIPFVPNIPNLDYPFFYQKTIQPPFEVLVDGNNEVQSVNFYPQFKNYQANGQSSSIGLEQAIENIKKGQVSIIDSVAVDDNPATLKDISAAQFSAVSIEYREDPSSGFAYPFYHFSGTGQDSDGKSASIEVITPAVQTKPNAVN